MYVTASGLGVGAWVARDQSAVAIVLLITAAVCFILGMAFHHLTVEDRGDRLVIRFGPLPVFRRKAKYADLVRAEAGRTMILEGWGIHYSFFRGGWVWNVWGRDCVVLHFRNGGILRVGTDDAENLARYLEGKIHEGQ